MLCQCQRNYYYLQWIGGSCDGPAKLFVNSAVRVNNQSALHRQHFEPHRFTREKSKQVFESSQTIRLFTTVAKKVKMRAPKKGFPQIHMDTDILQKTGSKLVIFGLCGPIYNLHPPYRGLPPCARFHNPDNREI